MSDEDKEKVDQLMKQKEPLENMCHRNISDCSTFIRWNSTSQVESHKESPWDLEVDGKRPDLKDFEGGSKEFTMKIRFRSGYMEIDRKHYLPSKVLDGSWLEEKYQLIQLLIDAGTVFRSHYNLPGGSHPDCEDGMDGGRRRWFREMQGLVSVTARPETDLVHHAIVTKNLRALEALVSGRLDEDNFRCRYPSQYPISNAEFELAAATGDEDVIRVFM